MATTTIFQRNYQNFKEYDKSLIIEMNETPSDVIVREMAPYNTLVLQPKQLPYLQSQLNEPNPGSMLSLESRNCIDQSDVQPLTEVYPCSSVCIKFHQNSQEKPKDCPKSRAKNAFLGLVILLLIVWIVVYTVLTQLKIL